LPKSLTKGGQNVGLTVKTRRQKVLRESLSTLLESTLMQTKKKNKRESRLAPMHDSTRSLLPYPRIFPTRTKISFFSTLSSTSRTSIAVVDTLSSSPPVSTKRTLAVTHPTTSCSDQTSGSTKKTHFIITKDGTNHLVKREIRTETDEKTHLYTLTIHPDNTYQVDIDGKEAQKGSLKEDFDILKPKEIKDPQASKPSDWVDERTIVDPEDKKPEGYDDIPESIADPEATKPDDWDEELDGEWERPTIPNPDFKGEWTPKRIPNPLYKGEWVHPLIANPDYVDRDDLYLFDSNAYVGFELWQVKSGTIFDNIIVTDDAAEAAKFAELTKEAQTGENAAQEKDEAEKAAAAKAAEESEKTDKDADAEDSKDEL